MKTIKDHLGHIILAIAGVALIVGVILAFATPVGNFFGSVLDKTNEQAQGNIWNNGSYDIPYTVSLKVNINEAGTVAFTGDHSGTKLNLNGDNTVTFKATANSGYEFLGWYEKDTLLSTDAEYSLAVNSSRVITAKFAMPALAAPTISLSGDTLTITGVANATSYDIYSDGELVSNTTATTVDMTTIPVGLGEHTVVVKAVAPGYGDSEDSNSVTYSSWLITDSWEEIISYVNDGTYATRYVVGAYKPLDLGSEGIVNMQIAAIDADVMSDGSGNAHITWIAKELLATKHTMNSSNTNANGWAASEMRTYLQNDIWALIPATVQNAIVEVDKTYYDYTTASTLTCSDKVWIPSWREVGLGTDKEDSGVIYSDLFASSSDRIKTLNGASTFWWLRSAYTDNSNSFYNVYNFGGGGNGSSAYNTRGVALSFCF